MTGTLILLPNMLTSEMDHVPYFSPIIFEKVFHLDGLIAETEKPARYFLKRFPFSNNRTFRDIPIRLLNEHTKKEELSELMGPLIQGQTWGLISDCGLPCFADPGHLLVNLCREKQVSVEAYMGPSAILQSILLSGFSAQSFFFHGYLPQEKPDLVHKIASMEESCHVTTHVFIEAPYRSDKLLKELLSDLKEGTRLCLAIDVMLETQQIIVKSVKEWKKQEFTVGKRPTVFLIAR